MERADLLKGTSNEGDIKFQNPMEDGEKLNWDTGIENE